ncbi:MAG: GlmU family protein [Bacteroidetes bacterium]|nr:GlmU family protein [Bacteroidota bacterium]
MRSLEHICIFEDDGVSNFLPLTWTRPVFDLRCGAMTLAERIRKFFPEARLHLQCRDYLADVVAQSHPYASVNQSITEPCLFINGRTLFDQTLFERLLSDDTLELTNGDSRLAFWNTLTPRRESCNNTLLSFPWNLVSQNVELLKGDFDKPSQMGNLYDGVHLVNPDRISIGKDTVIKPGVVLDAENGPISIGDHVHIMANSVIEGPVNIGSRSLIKIGAKIYGGTTIGPSCKVGGEVEASVLQGFSNKQHDGFLGHSFVGEWCNLGADTNTSDLKNNYSTVKVTLKGEEIDTGERFVGLIMGDHSKSGINTMFNTGTVVGVSCNIFGAGHPPKTIPSFSWVDGQTLSEYRLEKALSVAEIVMGRRKVVMSAALKRLMEHVYYTTSPDRSGFST